MKKMFILTLFLMFLLDVSLFNNSVSRAEKKILNDTSEIRKLYKNNEELNRLISRKKWEKIYEKLQQSKQSGAYKYKIQNRETFLYEHKNAYLWPLFLKLESLAYIIKNDSAYTSNLLKMKIIFFPYKTYADTTFHIWKKKDGEWYLLDFEIRDYDDEWLELQKARGVERFH
ncbi:MAG: hypothetical protein EH225_05590 [Calditrichaeota bacterium]|nr:hypothetical protein [Calditrichota bacterium]RQW04655.1 MAG: hypothetical protein EH225_05590 [Calditrichota bacterium]